MRNNTMQEYHIKVKRSGRKTLALEISRDGQILVRAPYRASETEIRQFVDKKSEPILPRCSKG